MSFRFILTIAFWLLIRLSNSFAVVFDVTSLSIGKTKEFGLLSASLYRFNIASAFG
jgi:hypothetical protein